MDFKQSKHKFLQDINIYVRAGEIVGLAGIEGNGQLELVEAIIGDTQTLKGKIYIDKNDISNKSITERRSLISYIPSDRKKIWIGLECQFSRKSNYDTSFR